MGVTGWWEIMWESTFSLMYLRCTLMHVGLWQKWTSKKRTFSLFHFLARVTRWQLLKQRVFLVLSCWLPNGAKYSCTLLHMPHSTVSDKAIQCKNQWRMSDIQKSWTLKVDKRDLSTAAVQIWGLTDSLLPVSTQTICLLLRKGKQQFL